MCCPLDQCAGKFIVNEIAFEENGAGEKVCHVRGIYDHTPHTLADRISNYFQRLELLEKIAEISDESFHTFGFLFQRYASVPVYQTLRDLHHSSHNIEHILHSFCFLGDLTRMFSGKFFEYQDEELTQLDYLRSTSRVFHTSSHFFATLEFLYDHKLRGLEGIESAFKYTSALNAAGYGLWTISLIWKRFQGIENENFATDMSIHLGGFLFEAIPLAKSVDFLAPYSPYLSKAASIAGIVHAWFIVQRLMARDSETIESQFIMPEDIDENPSPHDELFPQNHDHDHNHDHNHGHRHVKYRSVKTSG